MDEQDANIVLAILSIAGNSQMTQRAFSVFINRFPEHEALARRKYKSWFVHELVINKE